MILLLLSLSLLPTTHAKQNHQQNKRETHLIPHHTNQPNNQPTNPPTTTTNDIPTWTKRDIFIFITTSCQTASSSCLLFDRFWCACSVYATSNLKNSFPGHPQSLATIRTVPPSWIIEPTDVNVERNRNVMLHCQAQGVPSPVVVWKRTTGMTECFCRERLNNINPPQLSPWQVENRAITRSFANSRTPRSFQMARCTCRTSRRIARASISARRRTALEWASAKSFSLKWIVSEMKSSFLSWHANYPVSIPATNQSTFLNAFHSRLPSWKHGILHSSTIFLEMH